MLEAIKRIVWAITVQEAIGLLLLLGVIAYVVIRSRVRSGEPANGSVQTTTVVRPNQLLGGFAALGVAIGPSPAFLNYSISDFATGFAVTASCDRAASTTSTAAMTLMFRAVTERRANSAFNIVFHATGVEPGRYEVPLVSTSRTAGIVTLDSCGPGGTPAGPTVPACANERMGAFQVSWAVNLEQPGAPLIRLRIPQELLPSKKFGADWQCNVREGDNAKSIGSATGRFRFGDKHFEADLGSGNVQFRPDITKGALGVLGDTLLELVDIAWGQIIGGVAGMAVIVSGITWLWRRRRLQRDLVIRVVMTEPEHGHTLGRESIARTATRLSDGRCTVDPIGADGSLVLRFPDQKSLIAFKSWLSSSGLGTLAPRT